MKVLFRSILIAALCCWASAFAQSSMPLCSPPLDPDCVWPQWGSIEPDDTNGLAASSSSVAAAGTSQPALVRVAMATDSSKAAAAGAAPKIIVDDGKKFARETSSLVSAIKAARFDREGKLISGSERITAAVERVKQVSRNHQLTLYLKASVKLSDPKRALLARKVDELNAVLERSARRK